MKKAFVCSLCLFALALSLAGCSTQSSETSNEIPARSGDYTYLGTQSPGDAWSWNITQTSIIGTNETTGKYYSGSYTAYNTGFNKAVISSSNDTSVPLDGSAIFYFLEYPNTMLLVKPGGENDNVILCSARATTAPSAGQYNYVTLPHLGWTAGNVSYGTVEVSASEGSYTFNVRSYDLYDSLLSYTTETGFTFANGILSKTGSSLQIFMTPSGIYMGDNGEDQGGFGGVAKQAVDLADLTSKEYRGVLFAYDAATGAGETLPIGAGPHATDANTLAGFAYENVETGTRSPGGATLYFSSQAPNGIILGTLTDGSGTANFRMVAAKISGKYVALGISDNGTARPQNFLVIEQ